MEDDDVKLEAGLFKLIPLLNLVPHFTLFIEFTRIYDWFSKLFSFCLFELLKDDEQDNVVGEFGLSINKLLDGISTWSVCLVDNDEDDEDDDEEAELITAAAAFVAAVADNCWANISDKRFEWCLILST